MSFNLDDYVTVAERIELFREKHPDGSLQAEIVEHTDSRVTVKAWAYRTPDDLRPGVAHSALSIPGSTPYTRGSELENAETSAFGRAIVAALAADTKRGIATQDDVRKASTDKSAAGAPVPDSRKAPPNPNDDMVTDVVTVQEVTGPNDKGFYTVLTASGLKLGTNKSDLVAGLAKGDAAQIQYRTRVNGKFTNHYLSAVSVLPGELVGDGIPF